MTQEKLISYLTELTQAAKQADSYYEKNQGKIFTLQELHDINTPMREIFARLRKEETFNETQNEFL